jgi:hypothetical protein
MIYKKYIAPEPNPDLYIHLSKVLNIYNLNNIDYDYIYNNLYHIIEDFESIPGFIRQRDITYKQTKRKSYKSLFESLKRIKTPSI